MVGKGERRESNPRPLGPQPSAGNPQHLGGQALTETPDPGSTKYATKTAPDTLADPALGAVVKAWPTLPEPVKAGILAMIEAASKSE